MVRCLVWRLRGELEERRWTSDDNVLMFSVSINKYHKRLLILYIYLFNGTMVIVLFYLKYFIIFQEAKNIEDDRIVEAGRLAAPAAIAVIKILLLLVMFNNKSLN